MTIECPPLELTFAGCLGRWRVADKVAECAKLERPAERRFAVMGKVVGFDAADEVELCAVAYRPHAEAIAALPELVNVALDAMKDAITYDNAPGGAEVILNLDRDTVSAAIAKAEGRAA